VLQRCNRIWKEDMTMRKSRFNRDIYADKHGLYRVHRRDTHMDKRNRPYVVATTRFIDQGRYDGTTLRVIRKLRGVGRPPKRAKA